MSDLLDDQHARVALDLLDANNTLTVYDGVLPNQVPPAPALPLPYVLVYSVVAWPSGDEGIGNALDHNSVTCRTTWYIHCVGKTATACRVLSMQVRSSLLDAQPSIAGRNCSRLTFDDSQPPNKDETTGGPVMDLVLTYSFTSVPG